MEIRFVFLILNLSLLTNMHIYAISSTKYIVLVVFILLEILCSIVTLLAYQRDKKKAEKGKWRTKEKTLLLMPWLFGSVGGLAGIYLIRHKTKHWYFKLNNTCAFIVHCIVFALLIIYIRN